MTDFLNNLRKIEGEQQEATRVVNDFREAVNQTSLAESRVQKSLVGKIILDPTLDPDPYGYHNIPLSVRLQTMGWK